MFSTYGIIKKANYDDAFDAYCNGHRILMQEKGKALEDRYGNGIALAQVSKKIVKLNGEWGIFRFKRFVEELKEKMECGLDFYIVEKRAVAV